MTQHVVRLEDLVNFLNYFFNIDQYPDERMGIYHPANHAIQRLGLALEPSPELMTWLQQEHLDALFLHRPWKFDHTHLTEAISILAYHLAFDEKLTLGFNPRLADVLCLSNLEVLGEKQGRAIGMIGSLPTQSFATHCRQLTEVFGGLETVQSTEAAEIRRVAIVGAMTEALVREAVDRGAQVYVTGQFRHPAKVAVAATGIGVVAVGHTRTEQWGLRALANLLRERWVNLEVLICPNT